MSLINQMLRDLELRHTDQPGTGLPPIVHSAPKTAAIRRAGYWNWAIPAVLLAAVIAVKFGLNPASQPAPTPMSVPAVSVPATAAAAPSSSPAPTAQEIVAMAPVPAAAPAPLREPATRTAQALVESAAAADNSSAAPTAATSVPVKPERAHDEKATQKAVKPAPPAAAVPAQEIEKRSREAAKPSEMTVAAEPPALNRPIPALMPKPHRRPATPAAARPGQPADAESLYRDGAAAFGNGRLGTARELLEGALALNTRHGPARLLLARTYLGAGEWEYALELLDRDPLLDSDPGAVQLRAEIDLHGGRLDQAADRLERALRVSAAQPDLAGFLAALRQRQGLDDQAAALYREALQARPRQGKWWLGLGISLENLGRAPEALSAYRAAARDQSLAADARAFAAERLTALAAGG